MKKPVVWAVAPVAAVLAATSLHAQQYSSQYACRNECGHCAPHSPSYLEVCEAAFYDNLMWPKQYVHPSRRGICQSFDLMATNGWRRNNLLGKYHFNPEEAQLSDAGRAKVSWILTQVPANRRSIFVERTADQQITTDRIQAVQDLAASTTGAEPANVQDTHIRDDGRPAGDVDAVFTGFSANRLPPVLPQSEGASTSAGSSQ